MSSEIADIGKVMLSPVLQVKDNVNGRQQGGGKVGAKSVDQRQALILNGSVNEQAAKRAEKEKEKASGVVTFEQLKDAAKEGNSVLQVVHRNLEIQVHEATEEIVVKVVDSETGELVRQIPSEEMLKFLEGLKKRETEGGTILQDRV